MLVHRWLRPNRALLGLASLLALLLGVAAARAQSPAGQGAPAKAPHTDTRKGKKAYQKGLQAEEAQDWSAAFQAYTEAANYVSGNPEWLLRRELARFRMVEQYTDRAEREAVAGRLDEARAELRAALKLDPSYSVARERLAQLQAAAPQPPQQVPSLPSAPVHLRPRPGIRDFNYRGDARGAYELVAREFGLFATFDPDLPAKNIRFRVTGVDFDAAMTLLSQQTRTLWRATDPHTLFVFQDTPQKRAQYGPLVERTFALPASTTPDRMTETMRLIRDITGITRTELDTRTRTLTVRDSPRNIALAESLIQAIEQPPGEVMLEIELLEVNRNEARRLGITPPSTARALTISTQDIRALEQAQTPAALLAILQRIFGTPGALAGLTPEQIALLTASGQASLGALVPPVVKFGGGKTTYLATLPGAAADFSEFFSLVRSGRRVLLRAQEGQPATLFVGERFPVTLSLLSATFNPNQFTPTIAPNPFPRADIAVGGSPSAIVSADLNSDGFRDLAVANEGDNTLSILLGKGDGTFPNRADFATGNAPAALVLGDFNRDGPLDLVVANRDANTVSILLGNGDGTFAAKTDFPGGNRPVAVAAGDFNGDGNLDLAVANEGDNTVSVLLGRGDGSFDPRKDFPTGNRPVSIATGDLTGDGKLDLVVADNADDTVSVLLGSGDGTFGPKKDFPSGSGPSAVVVADFNSDGRPDVAAANQSSNTVSVLLGNGDGTLAAKKDFATGNGPSALAAADLTRDGKIDLIATDKDANAVSILPGNGDGTFGSRLDFATGTAPVSVVAGDFTGDAQPDLAIAAQGANSITIILNILPILAPTALPQSFYPGSAYEDLGLKVRATPRLHPNNEVTLQLQFEIRNLAGTFVNGIPVISNRTLEQTVRLRQNETTLLTGIVQQEETRSITGTPGIARVTGAGHLAGRRDLQARDTELLILITPRLVRRAPRTDRSIYAGRGDITPGAPARPPVQQ